MSELPSEIIALEQSFRESCEHVAASTQQRDMFIETKISTLKALEQRYKALFTSGIIIEEITTPNEITYFAGQHSVLLGSEFREVSHYEPLSPDHVLALRGQTNNAVFSVNRVSIDNRYDTDTDTPTAIIEFIVPKILRNKNPIAIPKLRPDTTKTTMYKASLRALSWRLPDQNR